MVITMPLLGSGWCCFANPGQFYPMYDEALAHSISKPHFDAEVAKISAIWCGAYSRTAPRVLAHRSQRAACNVQDATHGRLCLHLELRLPPGAAPPRHDRTPLLPPCPLPSAPPHRAPPTQRTTVSARLWAQMHGCGCRALHRSAGLGSMGMTRSGVQAQAHKARVPPKLCSARALQRGALRCNVVHDRSSRRQRGPARAPGRASSSPSASRSRSCAAYLRPVW